MLGGGVGVGEEGVGCGGHAAACAGLLDEFHLLGEGAQLCFAEGRLALFERGEIEDPRFVIAVGWGCRHVFSLGVRRGILRYSLRARSRPARRSARRAPLRARRRSSRSKVRARANTAVWVRTTVAPEETSTNQER